MTLDAPGIDAIHDRPEVLEDHGEPGEKIRLQKREPIVLRVPVRRTDRRENVRDVKPLEPLEELAADKASGIPRDLPRLGRVAP